MDSSPEEILKRLEELRCWQGQQQEKLLSKQLSRSQLCSMEQKKLYEMFGLSLTSTVSTVSNVSNLSFSEYIDQQIDRSPPKEDKFEMDTSNVSATPATPQKQFRVETPINNFSLEELESYGKESNNQQNLDIADKPKKSFLKRGQGLAARFKIHPEKFRIENLPKYKFANSHKKSKFFRDDNQLGDAKRCDIPKTKPLAGDTKLTKTNPIRREISSVSKRQNEFIDDVHSGPARKDYEQQPLTNKNFPPSATWTKVLESEQQTVATANNNPSNILNTPTMEERSKKQHQDERDLQIFELLEQNLNNSGISHDSIIMKQLMNYILSNANKNPLQPSGAQQELQFEKLSVDDSADIPVSGTAKRNVRFEIASNDKDVDSECETIASTDIDEIDHTKTSTPITKTPFELFKQNLFIENDSTLVEDTRKDNSMKIRNEELKHRLTELQNEIELFRQQNAMLTKSMREHEVEKLLWEEQKNEMMDKIEDERIRQEVYLHDERMKLIEEQKKLDKRAKELRAPNRKDKEEVAKLKQEIADLQKELANKDQKHVSAQARLRAQIRNAEKDLKEFSMEIDNLRKENKKIESENVRLRRQNNNKMLNEINKNIAKLAPKAEIENVQETSSNKNARPTVATQSHPEPKSMGNRSKSITNLIEVKEIPKTCQSDESDSDVSSSSSSPIDERSTYFKDKRNSKSANNTEKIPTQLDGIPTSESTLNLKREIINDDGSRDIWYPNGNLKKVSADEMVIRMLYFNKDVKETNIHEGTVKYYYAEANTWQTTYLDGLEIWEFPNGRNEHHYKDGRIEAHHPDGSICITNPNDMETAEEWKYMNGTNFVIKRNGDKYLSLPNGQREVTTKNHVRREYPDGTVKIKYPDGSLETRYSNGRIRLRDSAGKLIRDSET